MSVTTPQTSLPHRFDEGTIDSPVDSGRRIHRELADRFVEGGTGAHIAGDLRGIARPRMCLRRWFVSWPPKNWTGSLRESAAPMGIEAIYQKPNISRRHPEHKVYPYLLRGTAIERPNQV